MIIKYFIVAESVLHDARSNSISAVNILEELLAFSFPIAIPKLSVIAALERSSDEPEKPECRVKCTFNGAEVFNNSIEVDFQGLLRTRAILDFQGLPVLEAGQLEFSINSGGPNFMLASDVRQGAIRPTASGKPNMNPIAYIRKHRNTAKVKAI